MGDRNNKQPQQPSSLLPGTYKQPPKPTSTRLQRYSISVTGKTYDRLRESVSSTSVQKFVDGIITSALDDPTIRDRIVDQCRPLEDP